MYHDTMKQKYFKIWITAAGFIGIAFGVFYSIFGLKGLPIYHKIVPAASYDGWSRGLYGAVFIGFSVLLLLLGRRAIQKRDKELGKILFYGIAAWLAYEALFSLIYGVYINAIIDVVLITFLSYPLLRGIR
jgi:hypothetical protein